MTLIIRIYLALTQPHYTTPAWYSEVTDAERYECMDIDPCHQAVVDRCVDAALPDGSTDCSEEALVEQLAACH